MITEARKLQLIEEVLKIDDEALLAEIEVLLKGKPSVADKLKLSDKYRGALQLTDKQYDNLHRQLAEMRNEWERSI